MRFFYFLESSCSSNYHLFSYFIFFSCINHFLSYIFTFSFHSIPSVSSFFPSAQQIYTTNTAPFLYQLFSYIYSFFYFQSIPFLSLSFPSTQLRYTKSTGHFLHQLFSYIYSFFYFHSISSVFLPFPSTQQRYTASTATPLAVCRWVGGGEDLRQGARFYNRHAPPFP